MAYFLVFQGSFQCNGIVDTASEIKEILAIYVRFAEYFDLLFAIEDLFDYWVGGKKVGATGKRWCVIHDVLGWVD